MMDSGPVRNTQSILSNKIVKLCISLAFIIRITIFISVFVLYITLYFSVIFASCGYLFSPFFVIYFMIHFSTICSPIMNHQQQPLQTLTAILFHGLQHSSNIAAGESSDWLLCTSMVHLCVHRSLSLSRILNQSNLIHSLKHNYFNINFNITSPLTLILPRSRTGTRQDKG